MTMNHLANEKSPYLIQHAENPVDWYPWGTEAFEKARREDKPIFLSIGYSTCHWCHVMEKESFTDDEVARLMNESFVSVKVDREERPDIDHIYMTAAQMMSGQGGWPLNVLLAPDGRPFYAATYIPKLSRSGLPGMLDIIPHIKHAWTNRREEVMHAAGQITNQLSQIGAVHSLEIMDKSALYAAYRQLEERFDRAHGGFSKSPKFPTPHNFYFLLRYFKRTGDNLALEMVEKTLTEMRKGGIFDHVGFGFHRYATDALWLVPHFEKMLYDQALLAIAYADTYRTTGKEFFGKTAREVCDYVLRDMTSDEGGFYAGEDADSEGIEGKFYVWKETDILEALGVEEGDIAKRVFHIETSGNFKEPGMSPSGENILHMKESISELASEMGIAEKELASRIESIRMRLLDVRSIRIRPHLDDKILTDWNGLMIAALAIVFRVFPDNRYLDAAKSCADFIYRTMIDSDGRPLHRYRDGEAAIPGYIDDYAFLVWGLIELYEATYDKGYLDKAEKLNNAMLDHFWDNENGGLFFTADFAERLIIRKKEIYDGAVMSGNSVAALNILRLSGLTQNDGLRARAERIFQTSAGEIRQLPSAYTHMLCVLDFAVGPSYDIRIAGDPTKEDTRAMLEAINGKYLPSAVVRLYPCDQEINREGADTQYPCLNGHATAYICTNDRCLEPTGDVNRLMELLEK